MTLGGGRRVPHPWLPCSHCFWYTSTTPWALVPAIRCLLSMPQRPAPQRPGFASCAQSAACTLVAGRAQSHPRITTFIAGGQEAGDHRVVPQKEVKACKDVTTVSGPGKRISTYVSMTACLRTRTHGIVGLPGCSPRVAGDEGTSHFCVHLVSHNGIEQKGVTRRD